MTMPSIPHPAPHPASLDAVRSLFPALQRRHNGSPVAYFSRRFRLVGVEGIGFSGQRERAPARAPTEG